MLVSDLISGVRTALHDENSALYPQTEALAAYNRVVQETQSLLVMMQARIAMSSGTITGDGTNYQYSLPTTLIGIVPGTLRPRAPITSTADYQYGQEITLLGNQAPYMLQAPTSSGQPVTARIVFPTNEEDAPQIVFPCILESGNYYDYSYWPKISDVELGTIGTTDTPWAGRCDRVLSRGIELILRTGAEYIGEPRKEWLTEATGSLGQMLGMSLHQQQTQTPMMFRNGAWLR